MNEIELDNWFFNLPADWQSDITKVPIDMDTATDAVYEKFDSAMEDWWDSHTYEEKLAIYEREENN